MDSLVSFNKYLSAWRKKVAFYLEDIETGIGLTINLVTLILIFVSLGIFVAETYSLSDRIIRVLSLVDTIILVLFTIEYLFRFWSAENRKQFFWSAFSLIDLLAIFPLLLGLVDIRFFRIFRWFRILRIIRFWEVEKKVLGITSGETIVFIRIFFNSIFFDFYLCGSNLSSRTSC